MLPLPNRRCRDRGQSSGGRCLLAGSEPLLPACFRDCTDSLRLEHIFGPVWPSV